MKRPTRKLLHAEGIRERRIIVYQDVSRGAKRIVVQWREWAAGRRMYRVYPASQAGRIEAVAYAHGVGEALGKPKATAPITTRELWTVYAELELSKKKPRTQAIYASRWRKWELFVKRDSDPNLATLEQVERFRVELSKEQVPNQVKETLRVVKLVFSWGQRMEKVAVNKLAAYRFQFAAGQSAAEPPEYTPEEFKRLVQSFPAPDGTCWRPWALIVIAGTQGPRIRALLHLRWEDVDLDAGRVHWTARFDKTARDRTQPLSTDALTALRLAKAFREIDGYDGPWVFYSARERGREARNDGMHEAGVYRYQSGVHALHEAERRAGVPTIAGRGFHALRKCAAGNALELFGNPKDALDWIGDTDPRRLREYAKKRDLRQQSVADVLSGSAGLLPTNYQTSEPMERPKASDLQGVVVIGVRGR